jgi:hypothetical protein
MTPVPALIGFRGYYTEAFQNYYEARRLEINPYDRSYILPLLRNTCH